MPTDLRAQSEIPQGEAARDVIAISPSDATDLPYRVYAIRATGAGNVVIDTAEGIQRTLAFAAGETRHVIADKVYATDTTATGLEGMA